MDLGFKNRFKAYIKVPNIILVVPKIDMVAPDSSYSEDFSGTP